MRACRLLLALALAIVTPAGAATYYVATTGSNGNTGLDTAHPWQTLQFAAGKVAPGDTVLVRSGSYVGFELTTSGTAAARITFANFPGEVVSITGDEPASPSRHAGINLEGASYATIQGFHVADRGTVGIRAVECTGVHLVDNVLVHNEVWGILTGCCDDLLIQGNSASGSVEQHGIYVGNSGDRPVITDNVVFDNAANGIHMNGDASTSCDSVAFDGVISNAIVEGNVIHGNGAGTPGFTGGGSGINCDGVQDSLIANNLIYDEHASGISLYDEDGGDVSRGNRVENNTVQVDSDGRWALNITDGATGTIVRNNILWSDHSFRGALTVCPACLPGFSSDYNVVESTFSEDDADSTVDLATWQADTKQDAHSIGLGPSTSVAAAAAFAALFVDEPGGDYHLAAGSAAIDAGVELFAPPDDLDGRTRPVGAAPDAGAYEFAVRLFDDGFERTLGRWSTSSP